MGASNPTNFLCLQKPVVDMLAGTWRKGRFRSLRSRSFEIRGGNSEKSDGRCRLGGWGVDRVKRERESHRRGPARAEPDWGLFRMVHDGSVTRLIQLLRSGDKTEREMAALLIWKRYFRDLLKLARNNLTKRIRRREDEEDVLQSMYKSFCLRQERGEFDLAGRDALWKLLVTITLRKARNVAKAHGRDRRDVAREQTIAGDDDKASVHWARANGDVRPITRRGSRP